MYILSILYYMGNTITKSSDDKRIGDSLLAKEVKNILQNQTSTYRDKQIRIHVAKACCRDVVRPDIEKEQNNVVSIAFPRPLNPKDERCAKNGVCLDTGYVGLQIADDRSKWCGTDKDGGIAGYNFSTIRGGGSNSVCDNFMMDYCAKNLYEQGCVKMGKNKAGALVPQFSNPSENKMCWDSENKMNYGPPECHCLNSLFGPNLNTWPAKEIEDKTFGTKNPYGLEGRQTSLDNNFSKYTLNIFKADKPKQFPRVLDARCAIRASGGDSSRSRAYTLAQDDNGNVSICLNQINIADSNIGNANFEDIKQENNCGGPPASKQEPTTDSVSVNPDQKIDPAIKAAADKKILDDAATKKKAEDEAKAVAEALIVAKAKSETDAKAAATAKQEAELLVNKSKADAEKAKADADKAKAKANADTAKAKADADAAATKAKADADAATVKAKADADAATAKAKADADSAIAKTKVIAETLAAEAAEKSRNTMYIGGGILLLIIIGVLIYIMSGKSKPTNSEDDE